MIFFEGDEVIEFRYLSYLDYTISVRTQLRLEEVIALKATFTVFLLNIFMRTLQKYLYVYTTKASVQI